RTFQIPNVFLNLSVLDNVLVSVKFAKKKSVDPIGDAVEALRLVSLDNRKDERAGTLNLFNKKLLMVATGLAADTKLLLLDEPIGGLNPVEVERTMDLIREVSKHGVSIILIEHIMKAIMGLSDRIMIMHYGEKLAEGTPEEVTNDQNVVQAYLGEKYV
ncbi:MAG: ABC transporter ATP-binding protein, partial [Candidatus Bathyarchaeia archaeon]